MSYGNYPDLKKIKRALVIKLRHHGDVLLTSPVFSNLKKYLPHAAVDALIYKETLPMLEGHPDISQFILYDSTLKKKGLIKKYGQELSTLKKIFQGRYDLVLNLTEGDRGAIVSWVSGAKYKVGIDPGDSGFFAKKKIYSHIVKNCPNPRHTVEKNLDALRRIGIFPALEERDLFLFLPELAQSRVQNLLFSEGIKNKDYIVIHPVSRWKFKCLPSAHMARVVQELYAKGEKIVLTSGPDIEEKKMVEEIISLVKVPVINLAGKLSLKELSSLIANAKCLICVDSVPLHIASAVKTPVVALFGPTSEKNWGPWMHPQSKVVTKQVPCRPCFQDGCGGSKKSDCLISLETRQIVSAFESLTKPSLPLQEISLYEPLQTP